MASKDWQTTLSAQVKLQALSTKGQFWWKNNTGSDSIKTTGWIGTIGQANNWLETKELLNKNCCWNKKLG